MSATPTTTDSTPKVWLITGCSSGIGRELAVAALARGDKVIATARSADKLEELKQRGALTIALDVTWTDEVVQKIVADAVSVFGTVDILVNNAGYSLLGAAEECSEEEIFSIFNTNVFGIYKMVRAVSPYMRKQKSGVIANVGSLGGWKSFPATGVYCTTKFAVAGLSESLRAEVAHLGIEVTCIDLGSFRTSFGNNTVEAKKTIADLAPGVDGMKKYLVARNGRQPGDPAKGAKVLLEALTKSGRCVGRTLPTRLAIGSDAVPFVTGVLEKGRQELQQWTSLVSGTDHDDAADSPRLL